jgi:hypothetical protein
MKNAWFVLSTLAALAAGSRDALAQSAARDAAATAPEGTSPVVLVVTPTGTSLRWSYELRNTSGAPVTVAADRRLLSFEVLPAVPAPEARGRRRARPARPVRCRAPVRPSTNENTAQATLAPGERYVEGFDLREFCGLRLPAALAPGAALRVRYGFGGRPTLAHAVVLDARQPPTVELETSAPLVVPEAPAGWPPPPPATRENPLARLSVSGTLDGATVANIRPTVRLASRNRYPMRVFFRSSLIGFDITGPRGELIRCRGASRPYAPVRDFFVPLTARGISTSMQLGDICPAASFAVPGIYRARAVFETQASGAAFGFQSFQGRVESPYFFLRIRRGLQPGRYVPLPVEDPFAPRTEAGDAAAGTL